MNALKRLDPLLTKILQAELSAGNRIVSVRESRLTILLSRPFHASYKTHYLTREMRIDPHDSGEAYLVNGQTLIAPIENISA